MAASLTHRLAGAAVLALPLLGLVACGSETDSADVAATPTTDAASSAPATGSDLPACAEVWVAGQDLPAGYDGCVDGGTEVPADKQECSIGRPLVTYGDEFYAMAGSAVNQVEGGLDDNADYRSAQESCTG